MLQNEQPLHLLSSVSDPDAVNGMGNGVHAERTTAGSLLMCWEAVPAVLQL